MSSSKSRAASTAIIDTGIFEHFHRPMSCPQEFTDLHGNRIAFGAASHNDETGSLPCIETSTLGLFEATCVFCLAFYHFRFFSSKLFSTSEQTIWSLID